MPGAQVPQLCHCLLPVKDELGNLKMLRFAGIVSHEPFSLFHHGVLI